MAQQADKCRAQDLDLYRLVPRTYVRKIIVTQRSKRLIWPASNVLEYRKFRLNFETFMHSLYFLFCFENTILYKEDKSLIILFDFIRRCCGKNFLVILS
jgi:hypothetical protein